MKLALEEWHHWLEGAKVPFFVWTDHRNMEYILSAKRLNSRQACWSLFFDRFNFTLSYCPGSRKIKPDVLSRQFPECSDETVEPSTIVLASCLVASVTWEIEEKVRAATEDQPGPSSCPPDCLFVPAHRRSDVLQWGHASWLTCHPDIQRTQDFLQQPFWWSSLKKDVRGYVNTCPVCNQNKTSRRPPAGFLHPLPVPHRPWSHISLDFVTGLPTSKGDTAILTVVDRFEPQFTSMFWKEFCSLVGASVSLSSGFHPQSNGQTEGMNQDLETILRCLINHNPASWGLMYESLRGFLT